MKIVSVKKSAFIFFMVLLCALESPYADIVIENTQLELSGLPDLRILYGESDRAWHTNDLERTLGGIMLRASGADVAIFEALPKITPIMGAIPLQAAKEILSPKGHLAHVTTTGNLLKRIIKFVRNGDFDKRLVIYGLDQKSDTIGGHPINVDMNYSIELSESALLEIFGLSRRGGLREEYAIRAPFVEAIYGDIKSLYFIGGPKIISIADTSLEIQKALNDVHLGKSFDDIIEGFLSSKNAPNDIKTFIDFPYGRPHHVVTLDISYLDVGVSKNATNENYDAYRKEFPIGRGRIPSYIHYLIFAKMALNYDAPMLLTSLTGEIKYLNMDQKELEKDKTKIGLQFKLPWERSFFKDSAIVISPLFKGLFETKLLAPRTRRIDSLLGFNFDFTRLGFNFDLGPYMVADFNQNNVNNALDFGPAMNFFSKWSLFGPLELSSEITTYYLFPMPKNTAINKLAFALEGKVWLRLARFYDFSVSLMTDSLLATLQQAPNKFAISSIFGLTISYGRLFRLFG